MTRVACPARARVNAPSSSTTTCQSRCSSFNLAYGTEIGEHNYYVAEQSISGEDAGVLQNLMVGGFIDRALPEDAWWLGDRSKARDVLREADRTSTSFKSLALPFISDTARSKNACSDCIAEVDCQFDVSRASASTTARGAASIPDSGYGIDRSSCLWHTIQARFPEHVPTDSLPQQTTPLYAVWWLTYAFFFACCRA